MRTYKINIAPNRFPYSFYTTKSTFFTAAAILVEVIILLFSAGQIIRDTTTTAETKVIHAYTLIKKNKENYAVKK